MAKTPRPFFTTPEEAEAAFYEALERVDLDAMMAVWSEDDDVVCVHPGSPRLIGLSAIREAWAQVFHGVKGLSIQRVGLIQNHALMLAVHSVVQYIAVAGDTRTVPPVIATNVWRLGSDGWRLQAHHASAAPPAPPESQLPEPRILH